MRASVWLTSLVLASFAIACGDQPTEVVPERDGGMVLGPGGVALATSSTEDGLSITTDKDDYAPGDTVWFTGAGWPGGDVLDVVLTDDPTHDVHEWTIDVGADGTFRDSTYVVDINDLGVTFTLTATSRMTGQSLTVQFTDANSEFTAFSVTPSPVSAGGTLTWSASAQCTGPSSGSNSCANGGSSVDGPVTNGYTINLLRASGVCGTPGQTFVGVASATTSGGTGTAGGNTTAPNVAGSYAYQAQHPSETISSVQWPAIGAGNAPCVTVEVQAANLPPTAVAGGPYEGDEGEWIQLDGSNSSDPENGALTYEWSINYTGIDGSGTCEFDDNTKVDAQVRCNDDSEAATGGVFKLTLKVTDPGNLSDTDDADLTVNNVAPVITSLSVAPALVPVNTQVDLSAAFTDDGTNDTHTASINWDDGAGSDPGTVTQGSGSGSVSRSHTYTNPGIYAVALTVTDDDGDSDTETFEYVVVYDPSAGFVTGGGWINSPTGAYVDDPTLTGKATFGFVSKYQKGANVPTGNTEFQFHAADLNFKSTSYDWLVVQGGSSKATFKGYGSVNGVAGYGFLLSAADGSPDKFRIKIWETGGEVIYDNNIGGSTGDNADPATALAGGSIVIHVPKK